ncbi:uncharacterized protein C8orf76-like isoform X2 [Protopterus annectens]|uniref:uncharacterized protein C8orf76-like isoform X2 n=1 Tax=Protopterus annectens TaxID=7888 RepID=UPI001CFA4CE1|nr:uncharacterized protein C8orf76-like isoform X2 [Protopterus annectens]
MPVYIKFSRSMELLGDFDDSVFAESRERTVMKINGYYAKLCHPKKALSEYSSCLLLVPKSNLAMRRDLQESQARCLCNLNRHKEAFAISQELRNGVTNTDHLTAVLNLESSIYESTDNVKEQIMCLQQLILLHPYNPWIWRKLAVLYLRLLQTEWTSHSCAFASYEAGLHSDPNRVLQQRRLSVKRSSKLCDADILIPTSNSRTFKKETIEKDLCCFDKREENQPLECKIEDCEDERGLTDVGEKDITVIESKFVKELVLRACASFIRARLLLQLVKMQQSSFVLKKNCDVEDEIEDHLKVSGLETEIVKQISEIMGEDLTPEKIRDETQDVEKCETDDAGYSQPSSKITAVHVFEEKWFKRLKGCL